MSSSKPKNQDAPVVEDTTKPQEDVDAAFKETVTRAVTKVEVKEEVEKPTMDDENKTFRTRLVSFWMLTNAALAIAIENINGIDDSSDTAQQEQAAKQNTYFAVCSSYSLSSQSLTYVCFSTRSSYTRPLVWRWSDSQG